MKACCRYAITCITSARLQILCILRCGPSKGSQREPARPDPLNSYRVLSVSMQRRPPSSPVFAGADKVAPRIHAGCRYLCAAVVIASLRPRVPKMACLIQIPFTLIVKVQDATIKQRDACSHVCSAGCACLWTRSCRLPRGSHRGAVGRLTQESTTLWCTFAHPNSRPGPQQQASEGHWL